MNATQCTRRPVARLAALVAGAGFLFAQGCTQVRYATEGMPIRRTDAREDGAWSSPVAQRVMGRIREERVRADIDRLAAFGTRHTLSETVSETRGIGAARRWIRSELERAGAESGGRLTARFEEFDAPKGVRLPEGGRIVNVLGRLRGAGGGVARSGEEGGAAGKVSNNAASDGHEAIYIVAHYDSRNLDPMDAGGEAPGANDDGSGTAAVIEIARALAGEELRRDVVFMLTAGEEQGLVGAKYHADNARAANEKIVAVLSNDIIGDPTAAPGTGLPDRRGEIRLFSEGIPRNPDAQTLAKIRNLAAENDSASRQLARYIAEVAAAERTSVKPVLIFRPDRFLRGGDHSSFLDAGYAAVRFTEFDENYARQHTNVSEASAHSPGLVGRAMRDGDVPEAVDAGYVADVARLNAAAIVHLANAPGAPLNARVLTAQLTNDTEIVWEAGEGAAGYEVVTRATTAATWETVKDVGNVTRVTLPISKDDVFVGVRSYDARGYRSVVVFPDAAKE